MILLGESFGVIATEAGGGDVIDGVVRDGFDTVCFVVFLEINGRGLRGVGGLAEAAEQR